MRFATLSVLALSAAAASAQDQVPIFEKAKSLFDQAASYLKSAAAAGRTAAASNVAEAAVTTITWENWRSTLHHSGLPKPHSSSEAWMVYITGGNKTCHNRCARADNAWNEAVTHLVIDPSAPKLGAVDCDSQELLCGAWASNVPSIWFFQFPPAADMPTPTTIFPLNLTTVTSADIEHIHTHKLYLERPTYDGPLHPFDGWVAKYGLVEPMAYTLFYLSKIPNWAFMVFVSICSRWFINKRMPRAGGGSSGPASAPAARPAQ